MARSDASIRWALETLASSFDERLATPFRLGAVVGHSVPIYMEFPADSERFAPTEIFTPERAIPLTS